MKTKIIFPKKHFISGFTLIELLVVIAIIVILAVLIIIRIGNAQRDARDSKRLADVDQIQKALEMYKIKNGFYPANTDNDCSGFDVGFNGGQGSGDPFISPLAPGEISEVPGDPTNTSNCGGYRYYRYTPGSYGCDVSKGSFYVLQIVDMESSGSPHPESPGFSCSGRDWQTSIDWVTGAYTN